MAGGTRTAAPIARKKGRGLVAASWGAFCQGSSSSPFFVEREEVLFLKNGRLKKNDEVLPNCGLQSKTSMCHGLASSCSASSSQFLKLARSTEKSSHFLVFSGDLLFF